MRRFNLRDTALCDRVKCDVHFRVLHTLVRYGACCWQISWRMYNKRLDARMCEHHKSAAALLP